VTYVLWSIVGLVVSFSLFVIAAAVYGGDCRCPKCRESDDVG
jgi:hypothetical protein